MSAPTRPDWGFSYERTQRDTAQRLAELRGRGVVRYAFGDGAPGDLAACDPSRMTDSQIATSARLHAERVVNRAIAQHNEQSASR